MNHKHLRSTVLLIALASSSVTGCSMLRPDMPAKLNPLAKSNPLAAAATVGPPPTDKRIDRKLAKTIDAEQSANACLATAGKFKQQGLTGDAIAMFERARKHQPDIKGVSRDLAVLYDRTGEYFKAEREYTLALEASPNDANLLNDFGFFHYQRSQFDQAATKFRRAIEVSPENERAMTNLGMTLAKQNKFDEAEAMFTRVSGPAAAAYNIALLQAGIGNTSDAIQKCQQALSLQPTLEPAQRLVFQLTEPSISHMAQGASR